MNSDADRDITRWPPCEECGGPEARIILVFGEEAPAFFDSWECSAKHTLGCSTMMEDGTDPEREKYELIAVQAAQDYLRWFVRSSQTSETSSETVREIEEFLKEDE